MSAQVRAAAPLLAIEQDTQHGPTRALLDTLRANAWRVSWREGGTAMLMHPKFGTLEVRADPDNPDRLITLIDGRQVSRRMAMQLARGEA